jgi:hypothetical protein
VILRRRAPAAPAPAEAADISLAEALDWLGLGRAKADRWRREAECSKREVVEALAVPVPGGGPSLLVSASSSGLFVTCLSA